MKKNSHHSDFTPVREVVVVVTVVKFFIVGSLMWKDAFPQAYQLDFARNLFYVLVLKKKFYG